MSESSLFAHLPDAVSVYEVSPRDGLQNETKVLATDEKVELIDALIASGLTRIELTSFVSPKWIPQLADADTLASRLSAPGRIRAGVSLSALCPNAKGLDRAKAAGVREIAVFMSASETHNKKNVNKSIDETLSAFEETVGPAVALGMRVRGYVSTVWGCPYEGPVDPAKAIRIAERLVAMGCYQISLGDTIGVGVPTQTKDIVLRAKDVLPSSKIALHMHDTRGTALANVVVGLELGIRDFDASVGGLGGCPYAPGAAGNVATEDLVFLLHGMGLATGIDLSRLVEAGRVASES